MRESYMPVESFMNLLLGSGSLLPSDLLEVAILLGVSDTGPYLKLERRADSVALFEYQFSDNLVHEWASSVKRLRQHQEEAFKAAREKADKEAFEQRVLYMVRADGRYECPSCGATGSADEVKQYGRVVCPCGLPSAEG